MGNKDAGDAWSLRSDSWPHEVKLSVGKLKSDIFPIY